MTITEFLLARIVEDEAPTWELVPYSCEPGCCAPAGYVGHTCLICGTTDFGGSVDAITDIARDHDELIHRRSRVLAECEAKRRIVAEVGLLEPEIGQSQVHYMLGVIAAVYSDHRDYRLQEWQP